MRTCNLIPLLVTALALPIEEQVLSAPRILEFSDGSRSSVSEDGVLELLRDGVHFMDVTDHLDSGVFIKSNVEFPKAPQFQFVLDDLLRNLSKTNLETSLGEFSGFFTRYARSQFGYQSSQWLYERVSNVTSIRPEIQVKHFHHDFPQSSVIATIPGTKRPEDIVVIGAHQDSINLIAPNLLPAPGADDDGSGSMTILEALTTIAESGFEPENTVEFHWYAAEELGLLGSQDVFAAYSRMGKNVKAMLQQDMTGYSAGSKSHGEDKLGVIVDYVDPGLTGFIKKLVDEYCDISYAETKCGYACSDHASAAKAGYPSAFVIESDFSDIDSNIHTTEDKIGLLDFDHMLEHAKLTLSYAIELGSAEL